MTSQPPPSTGETREVGPLWWAQQCAGLAITLALMAVLATALSMLTRMLVEGTTSPDMHLPTFGVWFVLCAVPVIGSMVRGAWRELADERVHVDVFGNELTIDRWSPTSERERFAERVAADERASERDRERHRGEDVDSTPAPAPVASEELRRAALRRREVGPGASASVLAGRWSRHLRWLRLTAVVCLYGWLPVTLVAVLVPLPAGVDREWGLLPMLLLPIGWLLLESHHVLRHRWLRTRETRSDLALMHGATALVGAVICAVAGFTGLVMRDEYLGIALISIPLLVLCIWIIRRELRHHIPSTEDRGDYSPPADLTWID